jgi:Family of unknown function (DUF5985)
VSANVVVPLLAVAASLACTGLLFYAYSLRPARLLFWCALFFLCLTANSVLLFFSLALDPGMDLRLYRFGTSAGGLVFLLYGLIYEAQ